ncbi:MAG: DUF4368 domain-containing protein [Caecibacter sp.]|jgi:hypothetical protein|nr:DUF4368 domain-containing protein [Caecibacter sp.]
MVFCADCGSKLYQVRGKGWSHDKEYMVCANYRKRGKDTCTSHQIRNVDIENVLLYMIQQVTAFARDHEDEFIELVTKSNADSFLRLVKTYTDIKELNAEIIRTFIEEVYVYGNEKPWDRNTKKIKVIFNFIGEVHISK